MKYYLFFHYNNNNQKMKTISESIGRQQKVGGKIRRIKAEQYVENPRNCISSHVMMEHFGSQSQHSIPDVIC
jgi:hypothetical protein